MPNHRSKPALNITTVFLLYSQQQDEELVGCVIGLNQLQARRYRSKTAFAHHAFTCRCGLSRSSSRWSDDGDCGANNTARWSGHGICDGKLHVRVKAKLSDSDLQALCSLT